MAVKFLNTNYTPSEEESKRLEEIQMSIAKCRRGIVDECLSKPDSKYWIVFRIERLASTMREKVKIVND